MTLFSPTSTRAPDRIEGVRLVVEEYCRLTVCKVECDFGIWNATVWKFLTENLEMPCVCAKFIPKLLTAKQKNNIELAQDNLEIFTDSENMLKKITADQSWVYG